MKLNISVPLISKTPTHNVESAIGFLAAELSSNTHHGFNYIYATRVCKMAYKGMHSLPLLTSVSSSKFNAVGMRQNIEVITHAAPAAFGRQTQVFDLHNKSFAFAATRQASYRLPFFFIEKGRVIAYYLQPRASFGFSDYQCAILNTIVHRYLLAQEFYGEKTFLEFADVSKDPSTGCRTLKMSILSEEDTVSDFELNKHLDTVVQALVHLERTENIGARRPLKHPDLPLFG